MLDHEDEDAHVHTRDRFESLIRVMLCLRFFDAATAQAEQASRDLEDAKHRVIDAHEYWNRTRVTLMQAIQLRAMRRT